MREASRGSSWKGSRAVRFDLLQPMAFEAGGKENLGLMEGGTYEYKGTVDGASFDCTYDSMFDKGTFRMKRR